MRRGLPGHGFAANERLNVAKSPPRKDRSQPPQSTRRQPALERRQQLVDSPYRFGFAVPASDRLVDVAAQLPELLGVGGAAHLHADALVVQAIAVDERIQAALAQLVD